MADRISKDKVRTGFVISQTAHELITKMAKAQRLSRNSLMELIVTEYAVNNGFLPRQTPDTDA